MLGPEPYGALSNAGLVRLFAMISTVTLAIHFTVQVTVEILFPVAHSTLVVLIFAVLTKTYHEVSNVVNVHVSTMDHPLPAGSVQIVNVLIGILIFAGTASVITTLDAGLPQLFPYVSV